MDDDIIRILVSTDNHLGFQEKSPTRHDDSFASFEEVLITANSQHADFILLAGDMFHENKPSRRTVFNTLALLRKYCTGSNPVFMEIINKQEEIFKTTAFKRVNYEDPYQSISIPIFAIHGNHDDPSRDGIGDPLAALDFFSAANLINYIGKHDQVEDIEITPLLIKKGQTTIALYPLGAVRDERLGLGSVINIFVLHQNRDYGRGKKNCVHETMIPEWMDVVVWGNEHECIPSMVESLAGTFRIYQPGSSVATSLSEGESSRYPKHMGMIEIHLEKFRLRPIPYKQIRPFVYGDLELSSIEGLDARNPHLEDAVVEVLTARVKQLIRDARSLITEDMKNPPVAEGDPAWSFLVREPQKVIVRLRVDYSGFPMNCLNLQRFGSKFIEDVSNPSDIILFAKKKQEGQKGPGALSSGHSTAFQSEFTAYLMDGDKEAVSKIKVEDLVCDALTNQQKQLALLVPEHLSLALEDFVIRKIPSAINDVVESSLETTQKLLGKDPSTTSKDHILAAAMKAKESQTTLSRTNTSNSISTVTNKSSSNIGKEKGKKKNTVIDDLADSDSGGADEVEDRDSEEEEEQRVVSRSKTGGQKRGRAAVATSSSSSKVTKKGKVESNAKTTKANTTIASSRPSRAAANRQQKQISYVDLDDDGDEEEREEDMSIESGGESDAMDDLRGIQEEGSDELSDSSEEDKNSRKKKVNSKKAVTSRVTTKKSNPVASKKSVAVNKKAMDLSGNASDDSMENDSSTRRASSKNQSTLSAAKPKSLASTQQQKLTFSQGALSTTSSTRSSRTKHTSSVVDEW